MSRTSIVVATALAVVAGAWAWTHSRTAAAKTAKPSSTRAQTIPVSVADVTSGSIDVTFTGLGSVTPLATITVKTRVDGELMSVAYREGETVRKGDSLVQMDPRPYQVQLEQAEGQLAKDQSSLQNARTDLQRYQQLIAKNAVAQQVLTAQQATVKQDEGVIEADQAAVDSAKLNLTYSNPTAPITGRVGLRLVDPGNMVSASAGTPLAIITQMQPMSVIFTLPEQQVQTVIEHMAAGRRLRVDAMDREMTKTMASGSLATLDNQLDPTTGTLRLRAIFANADEKLLPNEFVNARLLVETKRSVTLVPNTAVQRNGSATFVYIVDPGDATVAMRTIRIGAADAERSEVTSGLAPGERVVTQGVDKLQNGTAVRVSTAP
jgi:multidrug efflux system membrane fusion protein